MRQKWKMAGILLLILFAAWMLWPRSLEKAFDTSEQIAVSVTIFRIENGKLDNIYESYAMEAGSPEGEAIGDILAEHTYHLSLSSLTGDDTISDLTMAIHLFNAKGEHLTLAGGTGELSLNSRIYRLDYWGADRGSALCEKVLAVLRAE